ncbi:hypothetical protein Tco_1494244 [Tanacetum coccineum]
MSYLPEEIVSGPVSQLTRNVASHLRANGVYGFVPRVMFDGVEGFVPQVMANSIRGSVSEIVANGVIDNGVMSNGVSESVLEVVANGVTANGVSGSAPEVAANGVMVVSSVNGLGSQVEDNGVIDNGFSRYAIRVGSNGVGELVSQFVAGEIRKDLARLREYRSIANGLRVVVRRRRHRITQLESLRNYREACDNINFWERMQLEDVDKGTRALLMMRETESKIGCYDMCFIVILSIAYLMAGLPRCNELRHSCCSNEWEDMFMLYCRRAAAEDSSLEGEINGLYDRLTARIEEREYFIDELDLKETQEKDNNRLLKLQILGREFELWAVEGKIFLSRKLEGL